MRAGVRDAAAVIATARQRIEKEPLAEIDYVELVDAENLEPVREVGERVAARRWPCASRARA